MTAAQPTIEANLAKLLQLPPEVRLEFGERLIASVPPFADPEVAQAWSDEIARRVKEIEDGTAELVPADQAMRQIREELDEINRQERARGGGSQ